MFRLYAQPGWDSGYSVSLENLFPKGFAGSNPAPGVFFFAGSSRTSAQRFPRSLGCQELEILEHSQDSLNLEASTLT